MKQVSAMQWDVEDRCRYIVWRIVPLGYTRSCLRQCILGIVFLHHVRLINLLTPFERALYTRRKMVLKSWEPSKVSQRTKRFQKWNTEPKLKMWSNKNTFLVLQMSLHHLWKFNKELLFLTSCSKKMKNKTNKQTKSLLKQNDSESHFLKLLGSTFHFWNIVGLVLS